MPTNEHISRSAITDDAIIGRLVELTGLDKFKEAGCVPDCVEFEGDKVRIHITWAAVGQGWLMLRAADGGAHFCGTGTVSILFQGKAGQLTRQFEALMRRIAESLGDADMKDIVAVLSPDNS